MNDVELSLIFQNVGRSYGYTNVTAYFSNTDRWVVPFMTKDGGIEWYIPDCFNGMSNHIMRDLAFSYYDELIGRPLRFMPDVIEYVLSEDFVRTQRPLYLNRNHAEKYPNIFIDGIPVYYGLRNDYSRMFRAIIVDRKHPMSRGSLETVADNIHRYGQELRSMVFCDKLHADCRHCISPHMESCQYAKDINNPPYKENCQHRLMEGVAL